MGDKYYQRIMYYMVNSDQKVKKAEKLSAEKLSVKAIPHFNFYIEIDIGDGRCETLAVDYYSDPESLALRFCDKFNLEEYIIQLLAYSIRDKISSMKHSLESQYYQLVKYKYRYVYANQHVSKVLLGDENENENVAEIVTCKEYPESNYSVSIVHQHPIQDSQMSYGAEKILLNSRTRQSRRQSILEVSGANKENSETNILQSLAYQDHKKQSCEGFSSSKATSSSINPISAEICQRIGKENIIEFKRRKSQQRLTNILEYRQKQTEYEYQYCHFRPKINSISQKVDYELKHFCAAPNQQMRRYEQLYADYANSRRRKYKSRQGSLAELSFKPTINPISNSIICTKRASNVSPNNSINKLSMNHKHMNCSSFELQSVPQTGRKPKNRNNRKLPIGYYLYQYVVRRRYSKQEQKCETKSFHALRKSYQLVSSLKYRRLNYIYTRLTMSPHTYLTCKDIMLSSYYFKHSYLRLFTPIFSEMVELGATLSRDEFVIASLKLFAHLSPEEKAEVLHKPISEVPKYKVLPKMVNSKSRELLKGKEYDRNSIYIRGLIHRRNMKYKTDKGLYEKARQYLSNCTFKPTFS